MRIYDLIEKKKRGEELNREEIFFFVDGYTKGEIEGDVMAALLMAIAIRSMTDEETYHLTDAMLKSGDEIDLSMLLGTKVDKHSTGGIGDKTTLVLVPLVASLGVTVAKMSGRGLGYTGGTIDKLDSIPLRTDFSYEELVELLKKNNCAIIAATDRIAPADKKIYALRNLTATVDSLPLIASSVMSKKLATGADAILLDVKVGSGAFVKNIDDAIKLAKLLVILGEKSKKKIVALVTDMDVPLGLSIGNALEVIEACEVLKGRGPRDLREECLYLASEMLCLGGKGTLKECRLLAEQALANGTAFQKFEDIVRVQNDNSYYRFDPRALIPAQYKKEIHATKEGYISSLSAEHIGKAAFILGTGRSSKEDTPSMGAGVYLYKQYGERVEKGDLLATLYTDDEKSLPEGEEVLRAAFSFDSEKVPKRKKIFARVTKDKVETF